MFCIVSSVYNLLLINYYDYETRYLYTLYFVLVCTDVCLHVLVGTDVCLHVLVGTDVCLHMLVGTDVCLHVLVGTDVCLHVLVGTDVCLHVAIMWEETGLLRRKPTYHDSGLARLMLRAIPSLRGCSIYSMV